MTDLAIDSPAGARQTGYNLSLITPMFRLVFILYCFEAGMLLLFVPWLPFWDRTLIQIPFDALRHLCLHPLTRSAVSGFGLVHLIWALHDVVAVLRRRSSPPNPEAPTVRGS